MSFGRSGCRSTACGTALGAVVLALAATLMWSATAFAKPAATITGEFADSCRDFTAHSSKDISHVVIHYADGRVVRDETVGSRNYSIDGGVGDEIDSVAVKSGTTTETFTCTRANSPPTAVLERKAGSFDPNNPPGTWTSDDCIWPDCFYSVPATGRTFPDERAVSFRGISSTDPDNDIVSWSLDFGDGTTPAGGSWATEPPVEVVHDYAAAASCNCTATLTVIDSAGQSSSDPITVSVIVFDTTD